MLTFQIGAGDLQSIHDVDHRPVDFLKLIWANSTLPYLLSTKPTVHGILALPAVMWVVNKLHAYHAFQIPLLLLLVADLLPANESFLIPIGQIDQAVLDLLRKVRTLV